MFKDMITRYYYGPRELRTAYVMRLTLSKQRSIGFRPEHINTV